MEKTNIVIGKVVPMMKDNIDTDQIMPKDFIKRISRLGYEEFVFFEDRYLDKNFTPNPNFILNDPVYKDAKILVSGKNFGCGSSREHAVWGIKQWGFDVVIAGSFSDIFYMNCTQNALLPIVIEDDQVRQQFAELDPEEKIKVDLLNQKITALFGEFKFDIEESIKYKMINGIDDIDETLQYEEALKDYENQYDDLFESLSFYE